MHVPFHCAPAAVDHLRDEPEHVNVCFASGVLYHMRSLVETIELLRPRFTRSVPSSYRGFDHTRPQQLTTVDTRPSVVTFYCSESQNPHWCSAAKSTG